MTAKETKWTPGPWQADGMRVNILEHPKGQYAYIQCILNVRAGKVESVIPESEALANARLIAVSPELYDILQAVYTELDERYDVDQDGEHTREIPFSGAGELMRRIAAVLAKARGEHP